MSRAKTKQAVMHDLQSMYSDVILTKKDCDTICKALLNTYQYSEIADLFVVFKRLSVRNTTVYPR